MLFIPDVHIVALQKFEELCKRFPTAAWDRWGGDGWRPEKGMAVEARKNFCGCGEEMGET